MEEARAAVEFLEAGVGAASGARRRPAWRGPTRLLGFT